MYRNLTLSFAFFATVFTASAQGSVFKDASDYKAFKHMEVGATVGTTGIGIDFATPINRHLNIRAGVTIMPRITKTSEYSMVAEGYATAVDSIQREGVNKMCGILNNLVGGDDENVYVDNKVSVQKTITYFNAKLLLDWYPFHKKNWHFTAGLYYGTSRFAKAINCESESRTMVAINLYNYLYDKTVSLDEYEYTTLDIGTYHYELDPEAGEMLKGVFNKYGHAAVKMGKFADGTINYVTPGKDGTIRATAESNALKPYAGFGYTTNIGYDKRWTIGFEAGALFWGRPHAYVENIDGKKVCLIHDVTDVRGSVNNDLKLLKSLPVLPNIEVRLAYTIF